MLLTSQYNGYVKNNSKISKKKFLKQKQTKSTKIIGVSLPVAAIGGGLVSTGTAGGVMAGGSGAITVSRGTSLVSKGLKGLQKLIKTGIKISPTVKKGFKIGISMTLPSVVFGSISDVTTDRKSMTTKEATAAANKLGYKKIAEKSHGQPIFKKGNKYITPDVDRHNGGVWKMANSVKNLGSKNTRMGTYDENLNRIGD